MFKNKLWPNLESIKWLPSSIEGAHEKVSDKFPERQRGEDDIAHYVTTRCPAKVGEIAVAAGICNFI
jgi:hypothetical protein